MARKDCRENVQPPELLGLAQGAQQERIAFEGLYFERLATIERLIRSTMATKLQGAVLRWFLDRQAVNRFVVADYRVIWKSTWVDARESSVRKALAYWRQLAVLRFRERRTERNQLPPHAGIDWGNVLRRAAGHDRRNDAETPSAETPPVRGNLPGPAAADLDDWGTVPDPVQGSGTVRPAVRQTATGPGACEARATGPGNDPGRGGASADCSDSSPKPTHTIGGPLVKTSTNYGGPLVKTTPPAPSDGGPSSPVSAVVRDLLHGAWRDPARVLACTRTVVCSLFVLFLVDDDDKKQTTSWDCVRERAREASLLIWGRREWPRSAHITLLASALLGELLLGRAWLQKSAWAVSEKLRNPGPNPLRSQNLVGYLRGVLRNNLSLAALDLTHMTEIDRRDYFRTLLVTSESAVEIYSPAPPEPPPPPPPPEDLAAKRAEYEEALAIATPGSKAAEHWRGKLAELAQTKNPGR